MFEKTSDKCIVIFEANRTGPGRSKLTTSLVNVSLNFQKLISQICQYFLLKKCEQLLHCCFIKFSKVNISNMPLFFC